MDSLFLQDPFHQAFLRATGCNDPTEADPVITSEEQWKKFLEYLDNDGLLDDQDVMDDIWQYASKDAKAFQEKGNSRIRLSFFQWREMLADRFPPDIEAPEKELIRVEQNIGFFAELVRQWDLPTMTQEETRSLLYIIGKMESRRAELGDKLDKIHEEDCYGLMLGRMWRLLGGKALDDRLEKRKVGEVNNPFRWQFEHIEDIEKASRSRKPKKIRFHPTRKSGPRGPLVSDSLYGVAQGFNGRFGVTVHVATSSGRDKEPDRDMLAVMVPSKAPPEVTNALMYSYTAARELGMARGSLKCLGKDWTNREESLYYYEYAPGTSLADLLISGKYSGGKRVFLGEDSYLFRYWSRELLWALAELQQQSCYHLLNRRLDLRNVVVFGRGLRLRLGNLKWGPYIAPFVEESDEALTRRMRLVMSSYGRMVEEMLGLSTHACWNGWYSNIGKVLPTSSLTHVGHYEAMGGVVVQEGDEVVVDLDAQGRWYTSCDVEDEGDKSGLRQCVQVTWTKPKSREDSHSFRICGRRGGQGRVVCQYYELEDPKSTTLFVPIPVTVIPVTISAHLKAILQCCQLAQAQDPTEFQGPVREYLSHARWKERLGKIWLSDLLKNDYYREMNDADLDRVMEDFEELFRCYAEEEEEDEEIDDDDDKRRGRGRRGSGSEEPPPSTIAPGSPK